MVAQSGFTLAAQREIECGSGHIRVAIAIAADPIAHAEKGFINLAHALFDVFIEARNFFEKSRFKIRERIFYFIGHLQLGVAQEARLPQLRDSGAQLQLQCRFISRS